MKTHPMRTATLMLSSLIFTGCLGETQTGPQPVPAAGKLIYNGAPVKDATISLQPPDNSIPGSVARTLADGSFTLTTGDKGLGAFPGNYKVGISAITYEGRENTGTLENGDYNPAAKPPQIKYLVPQKYAIPDSSDLTITIPPEGKTDILFDLK